MIISTLIIVIIFLLETIAVQYIRALAAIVLHEREVMKVSELQSYIEKLTSDDIKA